MQDQRTVHPPLWISETDEHGNRVRREVVEAAHRIWNRVLQHLQYAGQDIAPAAEILEAACHCVSRAVSRNIKRNSIRNLDSYLFWAFIRKHNRRVIHEGRIKYVESVESVANANIGTQQDWVSILEDEIYLKQMLCFLDERTRDMLMRRISGDSWAEIGRRLGISTHNAEVQFANGAKKARSRLLRAGLDRIGRGQP
jgi:hypothetical protein